MKRETNLFDLTAHEFAESVDHNIRSRTYNRGSLILKEIRQRVPVGSRLLDVGCGPGRISLMLAEAGYEVRGVDTSARMIAEAVEYVRGRSLATLRFEVLASPMVAQATDPYDAIVCSSVIEYVRDAPAFLAELRGLLRPDGLLVLTYANKLSLWRHYAQVRFGHSAPHFALQHQVWRWTVCKTLLKAAGFDVISGPHFFESGCDRLPGLALVSSLAIMGTLGLVSARRL